MIIIQWIRESREKAALIRQAGAGCLYILMCYPLGINPAIEPQRKPIVTVK
jgi:hypothetical protein